MKKRTDQLLLKFSKPWVGGGVYILASILGNFFGFLYSSYLGRTASVEEFGLIALFGSFLSVTQVVISALGKTATYRSAYLLGKEGKPAGAFWMFFRKKVFWLSLAFFVVWMVFIPTLKTVFASQSVFPFVLFAPVWIIGMVGAVDGGFIDGSLRFGMSGLLVVLEAISKFIIAVVLVEAGLTAWVYIALPASLGIAFILTWIVAKRVAKEGNKRIKESVHYFPKKFFTASILSKISTVVYLSVDVILVKRFFNPTIAGQYALLSLAGKMVYFFGSLFGSFVTPLVSKSEGAGGNSRNIFYKLVGLTILASAVAFIGVGVFGYITVPLLFGRKAQIIVQYLFLYCLGMACFTVGNAIVGYHQIKKQYLTVVISVGIAMLQIAAMSIYHNTLGAVVLVMAVTGIAYMFVMFFLEIFHEKILTVARNIVDFLGILSNMPRQESDLSYKRILIFSWRDTKHVWAGGSEVYIQEIAKRMVAEGNKVTVFCGNDEHSPRNQVIDGVQIVRRGGFYMVYLWAVLYYVLRFRGNFDVVVDTENGIPFFTPLYVRVPVCLIVHHVHQEVFRQHLKPPFKNIAVFLESRVMPFLYRNVEIVTVSDSSKSQIIDLGFTNPDAIHVIHPGISKVPGVTYSKTIFPSFLCLGRLQPYKRVDVAIQAFARIKKQFASARMTIAGYGVSQNELKQLANELNVSGSVSFPGRVTEAEKARLMSVHWALVQPSFIEGWGITVIESNSFKTPVIASNVYGLKDSVVHNKTGLLVAHGDKKEFAEAMSQVIRDPVLRRSLSRESYLWSQKFNWDQSAASFIRIIYRITSQPPKVMLRRFTYETN